MATKSKKNRSFRTDNLDSNDDLTNEPGSTVEEIKDIKIDTDDVPKGNLTKPASLDESPLLNSGRIEMDYTTGDPTAQQSTNIPDKQPEVQDTSSAIPKEEPTYSYEDNSAPLPDPVEEVSMNPGTGGSMTSPSPSPSDAGGSDTMNLPDDAAKEGSSHLSMFIMDAYERFVPEVSYSWSKANEKEIKKLEESGDLLSGALDTVKNYNKGNRILLEEKAKSDVKYLRKHLTKVLQIRQISATPETLLAFAIIIVVIGQIILFAKIKKESNDMMDQIMAKVNTNRQNTSIPKDEIITPTVEVV